MDFPPIATQNYRDFRPEFMGVPVRISRGYPRFIKDRYELTEKISQLYPAKEIRGKGLKPAEFRRRYRRQLDMTGRLEILDRIGEMAARHPGERLVLLCFEKVLDGEICHRRMFAEWFEEQTGHAIPEVAVDVNSGTLIEYYGEDTAEGIVVAHHNRGLVGPLREEAKLF